MIQPPSSWPFERPEQLADALREQDATPAEIADLLPAMQRLAEVRAPQPSSADTRHLIARLAPRLPEVSPVRQAIRAYRRRGSGISWLLATARTQVSLFGMAFWLVSALITFVGAEVALSLNNALPAQEVLLGASGPLLAFLGASIAFRGTGIGALECELVCLPSPVQLTIARLVIVLGYDLALGLALSLALWVGGAGQVLALLLAWFMPLLLVAGLALLLSLRLSVQVAASLAYVGWLAVLITYSAITFQMLPLTPLANALLGAVGVAGIIIALLRLQANMHRLLPRF
jgi:hypothetical protein